MERFKRIFFVLLVPACSPDPGTDGPEDTTGGSTSAVTAAPLPTTSEGSSSAGDVTTEVGESTGGGTTSPPEPVHGLRGEYWDLYVDRMAERVDATLDFDWGDGSPADGVAPDRFSIRWTGWIDPPETGMYTLISETDDGVRVWLDDVPVIDDWQGQFLERNEVAVQLTAGVPARLRVDYFELDMPAAARLKWSSATILEEVIPQANLRAAEAASGLPAPKPPYANPVIPFDCPDPGVLKFAEDRYYAVCTGGSFPIRTSRDLVMWSDTGAAVLPAGKPSWAANGFRNWAPELHRVGAQYVAYFTTVNGGDKLCIGAATASDPTGPYTESAGPLVQNPLGVIDATYVEDGASKYLIYKIDGNSQGQPTPIFARELGEDGLSFVGEPVQVLVNDPNSWEGGVVEAQWVVARDGFFFMFYSGNVYDHRYRTGVARSVSVTGPYEKLGPPILANNETWVGPGHGSVIPVGGLDYFVYHAWRNKGDGTNDGAGRMVLVDRIIYENGWPRIHDGTPSRSSQTWPGVP